MIKLGTNILSQTVQRNLGRVTTDLSKISERLASGQRINKASDDAAGLAIAMSLSADSRIFNQGLRNLNDGISATSIAEGAMTQLGDIVQRIEELASQSMNGTFSDVQRASMQKEVTAIQAEWNRIVEGTSFNGRSLLTGTETRAVLQGGKGSQGTLAVQIGEEQRAEGIEGFGGTGTTRISTDSAGNQGTGYSGSPTLSADGRYVAFTSTLTNLVIGDTNGLQDSFIKDTVTGITRRVTTDSSGNEANGASTVRAISADGRYLAFVSVASNLVAGDTFGFTDSFVKDIVTGVTTRVSTDSAGNQANGWSEVTAISADGRYVAFYSNATNLVAGDSNNRTDSFMKDTLTGATTLISTDSVGNQATGAGSYVRAISADGRYVVFDSAATNLVTGDTNGRVDSFLKDVSTGVTTRISTNGAGEQSDGESYGVAISADGRYALFNSRATNLVAGDTNGYLDGFVKDLLTGATTRITTSSSGDQITDGDYGAQATSISADGRYVAFHSEASTLVSGDTNFRTDSFVKDIITGNTTRISLSSSGGEGTYSSPGIGGAYNTVLSADGRTAVFHADVVFDASDTNGGIDVFLRDLTRTGVQQMSGMVVSNRASAGVTLNMVQRYRDELIKYRSNIGATTSRISSFMNTLSSANVNYKAAESRITDADVAQEAANSVRTSILQQAASALLGQANQAPQLALRLLQNA